MSEIRYRTNYQYPEDLPAEERVTENAIITQEPYEVSDEQLEQEADEKLLQDILDMADSDIKVPQIGKILKALIKSRR